MYKPKFNNPTVNLLRLCLHCSIVFFALNFLMWIGNVLSPQNFWVPRQFFGIDFVKENYQKTQGAIAYYRDNSLLPEDSLLVVLGLSSASEGISLKSMIQTNDSGRNILSLSGAGRNFGEINLYAKELLNSDLNPELVIFAINSIHLMDEQVSENLINAVINDQNALEMVVGWFASKRGDLHHLIDMNLLNFRTEIFRFFNNRSEEVKLEPWSESTRMPIFSLNSDELWEAKLSEYGSRGYYSYDNYLRSENQLQIFANLIQKLQSKGSKILIVWMPEHSSLVKNIPDQALPHLLDKIDVYLEHVDLPETIDYRGLLEDKYFNDISHMNKLGREKFSKELDNKLLRYLKKQDK